MDSSLFDTKGISDILRSASNFTKNYGTNGHTNIIQAKIYFSNVINWRLNTSFEKMLVVEVADVDFDEAIDNKNTPFCVQDTVTQ